MNVVDVFAGVVGTAQARTDILNAINSGHVLVNYLGHGSEEQWAGPNIFDTSSVTSLTNGSQLTVFLIMDCLNGFFQDVYAQPLGDTLMLVPIRGEVGELASIYSFNTTGSLQRNDWAGNNPGRRDRESQISHRRSRRPQNICSAWRSRDAGKTAQPERDRALKRGRRIRNVET